MLFKQTVSDVRTQLNQQSELGVSVELRGGVSGDISSHRGRWDKIPEASVVFVDIKGSTKLVNAASLEKISEVYTHFVRGMSIIFDNFNAGYVDIQGDGLFGVFTGGNSLFRAIACAITMNTVVSRVMPDYIRNYPIVPWKLAVGIGIDQADVQVRRLGIPNVKQNEVWAGKPVNMASKLSSRASHNQILVSDRVYRQIKSADVHRKSAILTDYPYVSKSRKGQKWHDETPSPKRGFDFDTIYRTNKVWSLEHADELCEAVVKNRRPEI